MTDEAVTDGAATDACVFCDVIAGDERANILHEDELVLAIDVPPGRPEKRGRSTSSSCRAATCGTLWR